MVLNFRVVDAIVMQKLLAKRQRFENLPAAVQHECTRCQVMRSVNAAPAAWLKHGVHLKCGLEWQMRVAYVQS